MTGNEARKPVSHGVRLSESACFLLLLAVCTALRCILSVYSGTATPSWDETLNLKLAQGIRQGGLTLFGLQTGYAGILYPVLLAPLWGIADPDARLRAIYVMNALLVSSAMIPAWLLCKKLVKRNGPRIAALALFAASPNLWLSASLTAECLYIPLALWGVWFILKAFEKGTPGFGASCGLGLWTFLLFLTAQSGMAAAAGTLFLFAGSAGREAQLEHTAGVAKRNGHRALLAAAGFAAAFAAAYLLVTLTVYGGRLCWYSALAAGAVNTPGKLLYWLTAALCLLLWFGASVLFLPALIPMADRANPAPSSFDVRPWSPQGILALFLCVYAVTVALLTACSVSVAEDFSSLDMRIVLRAFIPAGWLLALLFLTHSDQPVPAGPQSGKAKGLVRAAACTAILCLLFLRLPAAVPRTAASRTDAPTLLLLSFLGTGRLRTIALRIGAAILIAAGTALWLRNRKKTVTACVLSAMLLLSAVNGVLILAQARGRLYPGTGEASARAEEREKAKALGEYLDSLQKADPEGKILVIVPDDETAFGLADLYCAADYYLMTEDALRSMALTAAAPPVFRPSETLWAEGDKLSPFHFPEDTAKGPDRIEWIVCRGNLILTGTQYRDCTPDSLADAAGNSFARVYRNEAPDTIDAADLFTVGPGTVIRFTRENPDCLRYPTTGFSTPETGYTWTEGYEAAVSLRPAAEEGETLGLRWTWAMTNGEQYCQVYAGEELIYDGYVSGPAGMVLPVSPETLASVSPDSPLLTFRFLFPDAKLPGNGDPRILAVAFESLSLETIPSETVSPEPAKEETPEEDPGEPEEDPGEPEEDPGEQ